MLKRTDQFFISDPNVRPSEAVLRFISRNPHSPQLMSQLLTNDTISIPVLQPHLNITHLVEVKQIDKSFLISFLYYLGALTIEKKILPTSTASTTDLHLRIPNEQSRREYLIELQNMFQLQTDHLPQLHEVVTQMLSGDIGPMCNFIMTHILDLQRFNDVIHSMEQSLKSVFILAVTIARGPTGAFSEFNLTKTQADAVFLMSPGPGIHVEFKNTTVGQIEGRYYTYDENWEKMNQSSEEIYKMENEDVFKLRLQMYYNSNSKRKEYEMCPILGKQLATVKDKWDSTLEQAKQNRILLEKQHQGKTFISFAVYRVGLKKLIWKKID